MARTRTAILWAVVCSTTAAAQQFEENLAHAEELVEASQWDTASAAIAALERAARLPDERAAVGFLFFRVGVGLTQRGEFAGALPAFESALAIYTGLSGGADDMNVAANLNNVATCMMRLGRAAEAWPKFEQSAAMYQRIYPARDHEFVVVNLGNAARCLAILHRPGDELGLRTQVLDMLQRMHAGAHPKVAVELADTAACLVALGRNDEALTRQQQATAMLASLHGEVDHADLATSIIRLARMHELVGSRDEALRLYQSALAMHRRLSAGADDPVVAWCMGLVGSCLSSLDRAQEALPYRRDALAILRRLHSDGDHSTVATAMNNLAQALWATGAAVDALPLFEASLAMSQRLCGDRDDPSVVDGFANLAACLLELGQVGDALVWSRRALAMSERLYPNHDDSQVASTLNGLARALEENGRSDEALARYEAALATTRRLTLGRDHETVSVALNNLGACLHDLGRAEEALTSYEDAHAMTTRLLGAGDHPSVARGLGNIAGCLLELGRGEEALAHFESALAMHRSIHGDADHEDVATSMMCVALTLTKLGRAEDALPQTRAALAMLRRVLGDRDHQDVVVTLNNLAGCLEEVGRQEEALHNYREALAMRRRLCGEHDHPDLARGLGNEARCLAHLDRAREAVEVCERCAAMIERLRNASETSPILRQSLFDHLKQGGCFDLLQSLRLRLGEPEKAFLAAERSRSRDLLDLLEQHRVDPLAEAAQLAASRGDEQAAQEMHGLMAEIEAVRSACDRLQQTLAYVERTAAPEDVASRRAELIAELNEVGTRQRRLFDERARRLGGGLPVGQARTVPEIQSVLRERELLLEFTLSADASALYVLARDGAVQAFALPSAAATVARALPAVLAQQSRSLRSDLRGRDPDTPRTAPETTVLSRELFQSLIPAELWPRVQNAARVFVSAHRSLHRLPFEALVTAIEGDKPVYWIDNGPPIAYVPSGSTLHWLRSRERDPTRREELLEVVAVGDPSLGRRPPECPDRGVLITNVVADSPAARAGLQPLDIVVRVGGKQVDDEQQLRDLLAERAAATRSGSLQAAPLDAEVWRAGEHVHVAIGADDLGIETSSGALRGVAAASLDQTDDPSHFVHKHDLERTAQLPQLLGARAEAKAIVDAFQAVGGTTALLLGEAATEPAVKELAGRAKRLHFACHGIAEECAGQSLSVLVLAQPETPRDEDDGMLKLTDLLHSWRGRLGSCQLAVLSACRTNVGPTHRDDAPHALPLGFMFAGAGGVVSTLWAVDDTSTRELMTDFYGRLMAGETDVPQALHRARQALRRRHPDPFHWAPFVYLGAPD